MRPIGLIVGAVLAAAVVAEGAYIVHTRRQVDRLASRLESVTAEAGDLLTGPDSGRFGDRGAPDEAGPARLRGPGPRGLAPPRLITPPAGTPAPAPPDDHLPLPAALDAPESREQLRRFVVAQLEQEREQGRLRQEERFREREQARRERMAQELGLSPGEAQTFNQILSKTQEVRASVRSRIESGELTREALGRELATMREETDRQLKSLLGDDRHKKFEEMRQRQGPMQGARRGGMGEAPGNRRGAGPPAATPAP